MVSTPSRRRLAGTRVSIHGSPAERRKALKTVSGNALTPQRPISSMERVTPNDKVMFQFDNLTLTATSKPSAMKGSPSSRKKGHKRQNYVRISTLAPTILGYARSRSSSPFSMDEIREECEESPHADKHMNGDITLRPRGSAYHLSPTKLHASLTPSSPTLSMATFFHEQKVHENGVDSSQANHSLFENRPTLSRDSSFLSIPSVPSPTQEAAGRMRKLESTNAAVTPSIGLTRPSSEWDHDNLDLSSSPPFALHVTPSASSPSLYDPGRTRQTKEYDPTWPMLTGLHNPPSSGQEYDPGREFHIYSSPESSSSSVNPPFPLDNQNCSDPLDMNMTVAPLLLGNRKASMTISPVQNLDSPPCSPRSVPSYMPSSPPEQSHFLLQPSPLSSHLPIRHGAMSAALTHNSSRSSPHMTKTRQTERRDSDKENTTKYERNSKEKCTHNFNFNCDS